MVTGHWGCPEDVHLATNARLDGPAGHTLTIIYMTILMNPTALTVLMAPVTIMALMAPMALIPLMVPLTLMAPMALMVPMVLMAPMAPVTLMARTTLTMSRLIGPISLPLTATTLFTPAVQLPAANHPQVNLTTSLSWLPENITTTTTTN